jgi:hypothetical protein
MRATSRGGHLAVQEAILAQLGSTVRVFRAFGRIRRARGRSPPVNSQVGDAAVRLGTDAGPLFCWNSRNTQGPFSVQRPQALQSFGYGVEIMAPA